MYSMEMNTAKRSSQEGQPPPYKRARYGQNDSAFGTIPSSSSSHMPLGCTTTTSRHRRCEWSAEACQQKLAYLDTMEEAFDTLLEHPNLLMDFVLLETGGPFFYLTYALAHATKHSFQQTYKCLQVINHVLVVPSSPVAAACASTRLQSAGAKTYIRHAMQYYPTLYSLGTQVLSKMKIHTENTGRNDDDRLHPYDYAQQTKGRRLVVVPSSPLARGRSTSATPQLSSFP